MKVGVLSETAPGESRVALDPAGAKRLIQAGMQVLVEPGAGLRAGSTDAMYAAAGARPAPRDEVLAADLLLQVRAFGALPTIAALDTPPYRSGQTVIAMLEPVFRPEGVVAAASLGIRAFALELIPRTTRAQSMDVLSSMATLAGYRGAILAALELPRMFGLLMTAAGTLLPARVLILGAGVAGLQAIATAKRLGAVVSAYDVRPAAREQVESVGGRFVELELDTRNAEDAGGYAVALGEEFYRQQTEALADHVAAADVVIATAAIPGARSPILITAEAVARMKPGSVIVDLAADRGGNCALTEPDERIEHQEVIILGPVQVASQVPVHATQMFSHNVTNFILAGCSQGTFSPPADEDIFQETLVTEAGQVVHPAVRRALGLVAACLIFFLAWCAPQPIHAQDADPASRPPRPVTEAPVLPSEHAPASTSSRADHTAALLASITIFTLAVFVGFEVIVKVPPTLHTPLMSGSNAISGITVVGALIVTGSAGSPLIRTIGLLATTLAMVNVVGGYVVTDRMLAMFQRRS